MSHLHIPDGVLPLWIVVAGWVVTGGALLLVSRHLTGSEVARRLPLLAVMATFMTVVQSIALPPFGFHLNLTVLTGIILGPPLSIVAAFIVNLFLAMLGHGGITVVGLNTVIFGTEMVLGYYLFVNLRGAFGERLGVGLAAAGATVASMVAGMLLVVGLVAASAVSPGWQMPHAPDRLTVPNPLGKAPIVIEMPLRPERGVPAMVEVERFASLALLLGLVGWPIEATITGFVARYLEAVRPDLMPAARSPAGRR